MCSDVHILTPNCELVFSLSASHNSPFLSYRASSELLSQTSTEVAIRLDEEKKKLDSIASMFPTIPTELGDMRNTLVDIRTFISIKLTSELEKISISVEGIKKGMNHSLGGLDCNCANYNGCR